MDIFFIIAGVIILMTVFFFALRKYYRKVIKITEHDIVSLIHEQDKLGKELQYNYVEKKVMEKMLREKFDAMVIFRGEREKGRKGERRKGE